MVVIGISTGGPDALTRMLTSLPGDIGVPLLIVQHMPPMFTRSLAESLDAKCALHVKEARHREMVEANTVYIAPGGKQMKVTRGIDGAKVIVITDDPPENNCRPSADYLFWSAAVSFPGLVTAVIMTGMGNDGTKGLTLMRTWVFRDSARRAKLRGIWNAQGGNRRGAGGRRRPTGKHRR